MPSPSKRATRLLWGVLALSLLANLFLAGVTTGRWWDRPGARLMAKPVAGFAGRARLLPADERRRFGAAFRAHRPAIQAARLETRAAALRVREAIGAEPYDRAAVEAALVQVREATGRLQRVQQAALSDALAQVLPASRALIAAPPEPPPRL